MRHKLIIFFVVLQCFLNNICLSDISAEKKEKLVTGFLNYINNFPNNPQTLRNGILLDAVEITENVFRIEAKFQKEGSDTSQITHVTCVGTVHDTENGVSVENDYHCDEASASWNAGNFEEVVTEGLVPSATPTNEHTVLHENEAQHTQSADELSYTQYTRPIEEDVFERVEFKTDAAKEHQPVQLYNEVQTDTSVTSGEQFIAVPREQPACIGCASQVNPQATGVFDLALLGIQQLNTLEPSVHHTLDRVLTVERQVQVVNGVRYIVVLSVNYDQCQYTRNVPCVETKTCKVSVLEKPWIKLSDGSKYRTIVANNCTKEWIFHDKEDIDKTNSTLEPTPDYSKIPNIDSIDDIVKAVHNTGIESHPMSEKPLTEDEIKDIQDQIIPKEQVDEKSGVGVEVTPNKESSDINAQQVSNVHSGYINSELYPTKPQHTAQSTDGPISISKDKKKAIEDLLTFFDFDGFNPSDDNTKSSSAMRLKRSYDVDLKYFNLAEKFNKVKKSMNNAKQLYFIAQALVDYLNEMDIGVKNRVLKEVIAAEEEIDNNQHFFYIQVRVVIPCHKVECDDKNNLTKICNGIIDGTDVKHPHVLSAFCYIEYEINTKMGKEVKVSLHDTTLQKMATRAIKTMESESSDSNALTLIKILSATTQKLKGSVTKISMIVGTTQCKKTLAFKKRNNCSVIINLGSKICEVEILERQWIKENKITYICTDRPLGESFVNSRHVQQNMSDPKVKEILQEAVQYLEIQSNINKKQKLVEVKSISTQIVAGLLTNIKFTVGYTTCTNDLEVDINTCNLIANEPLRECHVEVWHRPLLENGRQLNVTCKSCENIRDNDVLIQESDHIRNKRSVNRINQIGGIQASDPNDPEFKVLAEESLQKYFQSFGTSQPMRVVRVDNASTQVVSGNLTRIRFTITSNDVDFVKCNSEIWEQPRKKNKEIKVDCNIANQKYRTKREDVYSGAPVEQNSSNPIYSSIAEKCVEKFLTTRNITQHHKVTRVKKVTAQIVSGQMLKLTFLVSPTNCSMAGFTSGSENNCETIDPTNVKSCSAAVWEKPWLKSTRYSVNCKLDSVSVSKREIIRKNFKEANYKMSNKLHKMGSLQEEDPSKKEFKVLADESLRKYQHEEKLTYFHKVLEVKKVLMQVVSGVKYKIDYTATPTTCSANVMDVSRCDQTDENIIIYCHAEIWDQPWLKRKKIDVSCDSYDVDENQNQEDEDRVKRHILGAAEEIDPNNEQYQELAEAAVHKFERLVNSKFYHKIVRIKHVSEQVLAGFVTTIDFDISPTTCYITKSLKSSKDCPLQKPKASLSCTAEIREMPSYDKSDEDIGVNCISKRHTKKKPSDGTHKQTHDLKIRKKRQSQIDDSEIDDDTKWYYAGRILQNLNEDLETANLQKLITIHAAKSYLEGDTNVVRMYVETAYTFCLRKEIDVDLNSCDEMDGMSHRLCFAKLTPSVDDELVLLRIYIVCEDADDFPEATGLYIPELIKISIMQLELSKNVPNKLVHQGEPNVSPSLDANIPVKVGFIAASTNCTKDVDITDPKISCFTNPLVSAKTCMSFIWMVPFTRKILLVKAKCDNDNEIRKKRSIDLNNTIESDLDVQTLVQESIDKLEMASVHRYKQRLLQINSYSSKIVFGKVTTIDFDIGYTSCLKYEWVDNVTKCEFLEHLPRRHCVSQVWERLWVKNGRNIEVHCQDDETPLEAHIEFESAETAMRLAKEALKHIESKYPHPRKQSVVRIFSLEKQNIAGLHYRMKVEIGFTDCYALSTEEKCNFLNDGLNRFCRVNIWLRPWTDLPPHFRVSCDYQSGVTADVYQHVQSEQLFYVFLTTYKPDYVNDHVEMRNRFEIFSKNVRKIHDLNTHERGTATYGVTRFADLTYEEFSSKYLGLKPSLRNDNQIPMSKAKIPKSDIPEKFDWRDHGAVTEVKDQGSCGSCWAFSVTGNIEGQWKLKKGELVSLSEQELVDCDKLDDGCNGGYMDNAYRSIEQLGGLETEDEYPYEGEDDKCAFNKTLSRVQISGAVNISSNETEMAQWLTQNGPISIGINANAMQFYVGGVSHPWKMLCNPKNLDHGVLVVGYGVKDYPLFNKRLPYWVIKNSWGKSWGESGYYRVYRGDGTCGVNQMASSAIV